MAQFKTFWEKEKRGAKITSFSSAVFLFLEVKSEVLSLFFLPSFLPAADFSYIQYTQHQP